MSGNAYALLVGNCSFPNEPKLPALQYPENDVDALAALLTSPEHGIFAPERTLVLKNRPSPEVRERANEVLTQAERDDLVLVYYAGHGKLNRLGKLHLATVDTRLRALEATSLPVGDLRAFIEVSRSKRIVILLDCCYSGAASDAFTRGTPEDSLQQFASGRGIHLITASTGIQVAEERERDRHGIFTKHLLAGLSGGADLNGDGVVGVDELYRYVHEQVLADGAQEPTMLNIEQAGQLVVSRSGRKPREERNKQIQARLFELAQQKVVTSRQVRRVLKVLEVPADQLTDGQRAQIELLDGWMQERLGIGELIECWVRIGSPDSTGSIPTIPAIAAARAPETASPTVSRPAVAKQPLDETPLKPSREQPLQPLRQPPAALPPPLPAETRRTGRDRWQHVAGVVRARWQQRSLGDLVRTRLGLAVLLALVFTFNWLETSAETWVEAGRSELASSLSRWGSDFAAASGTLEAALVPDGSLSFVAHDRAPIATAASYSVSYFFVFPLLCLGTAVALACRREIGPFRVYTLALAIDYAVSLPFFLLLPVPERWAFPGSGAILLSDRLSSALIDTLRPISGIDNCFPSFHTSMTVVTIAVCFLFGARLRVAVLGLGATVVLSTVVLGIHWLGDVVAGVAAASLSVALAVYLDARCAARPSLAPAGAAAPPLVQPARPAAASA